MLRRYDTMIIDEAHERSLNIDFILGYLEQLLPQRPDLKVIVTSRHHRHRALRRALRRPTGGADDRGDRADLPGRGALPAAGRRRVRRAGSRPGRRASSTRSRSCARGARRRARVPVRRARDPRHRRRAARQLEPAATPRCCRSTPGCRPPSSTGSSNGHHGRAGRGSCWPPTSPRRRSPCPASATWSTPAPPASPATASASRCSACRSSRCRRRRPTSAPAAAGASRRGICIRLYSEDDFDARPEFTDPEILRTNLASVILQMTALGLGDVAAFPFVDPPDRHAIRDGIRAARRARLRSRRRSTA